MTIQEFQKIATDYVSSPIWVKYFICFTILLFWRYVQHKKKHEVLAIIPVIISLLIVRDTLFYFLHVSDIFFYSDLLIVLIYVYHVRYYTGPKHADIALAVANLLYVAFAGYVTYLRLVPGFESDLVIVTRHTHYIWIMANYFYLSVSMNMVTPHNTQNAGLIIEAKSVLIIVPISFYLFAWAFSYDFIFIRTIAYPLMYLVHLYLLYRYDQIIIKEEKESLASINTTLDSAFDFMHKIGNAIRDKIEMETVLSYVAESAVKNVNADSSAILLIDEFEDVLTVKAVDGVFPPMYPVPDIVRSKVSSIQDYFKSTNIKLGSTILGEAALEGKPIYIRNSEEDSRLEQNTKNDPLYISSAIVMPLIVSNKILGVMGVINRNRKKVFSESDFEHISTFADYTSLTIDNLFTYMELIEKQEMEREVGIAADIQQQLLPSKLPKVKGTNMAAYSIPAKGVSGDYYDVIPIKKGKTALVMCDVAGKGVPASLVMVMIRTIIHLIAGANKDTSSIVSWINKGVAGRIALDRFATLSFLTYDPETRHMEYSNAAHHPLLIYRHKTKTFESLDTEGIPIGLEKTSKYGKVATNLESGDLVALFTDGIIEAMNQDNQQYSMEALEKIIEKNYDLSSSELLKVIQQDIDKFVGKAKQHDDQTLLLMKIEK